MRITAVLLDYPPNRFIGSELATHALLKHLQQAGHAVQAYSHSAWAPHTYDGVRVIPRAVPIIGQDLIITHPYLSPALLAPSIELRRRVRTPVVAIAHNARDHTRQALEELRPDLVIANCRTTARGLGVPLNQVVRPPIETPRGRAGILEAVTAGAGSVSDRDRTVGYVNSALIKGGKVLKEVMHLHNSGAYTVLGVSGGYGEQLVTQSDNGQISQSLMTERYFSRIKIHLQPSLEESWGMTNLQALLEGCSVITSDLPGIREALRGVPAHWVRWCSPNVTFLELDRAIREELGKPSPTVTEIHELTAVLWTLAQDIRNDRERFESILQSMISRRNLLV